MFVLNAHRVCSVVVGCLALAALVGCSSPTSGHGSPGSTQASSPEPSPRSGTSESASIGSASSGTPAALGDELERIALKDGDLANGYRLELMPGGDRVRDQITLDNCGFDFTTEAHRAARRQYVMVDAESRDTGVSNELVAYDSSQQAAEAITQWHSAAAHCPRTAVRSTVAGTPKLVERITRNELDVPTLPVGMNAITTESATARGQGTLYNVSVLQVKGVILDNVYVTSNRAITAQELRAALQLAAITGQRLADAD